MTSQPQTPRPIPAPDRDSQPFWDAAREHRLVIQRCSECRRLRHPPQPSCPACGSLESDWQEASGRGTVYSFVIQRHPTHPFFVDVTYNVALIELAEGTRLVSNVVAVELDELRIGMEVEVVFDDVDPEATLPRFHPVS